jgi:transcriptional regulator with XRE-family HTH domain
MQSAEEIRSPQLSDAIASSPELMREFQKERLATEVAELISRLMREKKMTRAQLAARLGKSRPFVTKLLRNGSNMQVRTLADVFYALGFSLRVVERPLSVFTPHLTVIELPNVFTTTLGTSVPALTTFTPIAGFTFTPGAEFTFTLGAGITLISCTSFAVPAVATEMFMEIPNYVISRPQLTVMLSPDVEREAA